VRVGLARLPEGRRVVLQVEGGARVLPYPSLRDAFADDWGALRAAERQSGRTVALEALDLGPMVEGTGKVICVGHNYRTHILEMGHELPPYPNVFCKFPQALVGPADDIELSPAADFWDWEAELALVVSRPARHVREEDAPRHVGGYTVANDISARDWQRRSSQWLLGKTFARTTPIGPWLVTPDEVDPAAGLDITCSVDGVEKQRASSSDLVFGPAFLVAYLSTVLTLEPGDVVLTGTPGGVGVARQPAERLRVGQVVHTAVAGVGELTNRCVASPVS
jgi:acylpyruvate hydrolase